ncbi:MAG: hypothetical protein JWQ64_3143 [Subtercola sp.]|nr:hypothetical protein [Subtercola sp.]
MPGRATAAEWLLTGELAAGAAAPCGLADERTAGMATIPGWRAARETQCA